QVPEGFEPHFSFANSRMAVDPRAERLEAVVQVKGLNELVTDEAIERADCGAIFLLRSHRVPRRKDVASIETNPEPVGVGHPIEDLCQLLKPAPEARPLPCGRLEQDLGLSIRGLPMNL